MATASSSPTPSSLKGAGVTAAAGWAARAVTAGCQLLVVRVLSESLGVDGFAAYVVIASLQAWFLLSDIGFGFAFQNKISADRTRGFGDEDAQSAAILLLLGFGLASTLIVFLIAAAIGPILLVRFATIGTLQAALALGVFGAINVGTGLANISFRILFAEHRGYVAHIATATAALLGVAGVWLVKLHTGENLALSLAANYVPVFAVPFALLLWKIRPLRLLQAMRLAEIWRRGLQLLQGLWGPARDFLFFAATAVFVLNIDYIVISQIFNSQQIAEYTIITRFLSLFFVVFTSFSQALWPVSSELIAKGSRFGLRPLIASCLGVGVVATVLGAGMLLVVPRLIADLIAPGKSVALPASVVVAAGGYWLLRVWCDTFSMVVMSAGELRVMRVLVPAQAVINLGGQLVGGLLFGLEGLIIGSALSFLLTSAWVMPRKVGQLIRTGGG